MNQHLMDDRHDHGQPEPDVRLPVPSPLKPWLSRLARLAGFERFELQTRLSVRECRARIEDRLAPARGGLFWQQHVEDWKRQVLMGFVSDDQFTLTRRPARYERNSFKPIATGTITPTPTGTRIAVSVGIVPFVLVFVGVFVLIGAAIANAVVMGAAAQQPVAVQLLLRAVATLGVLAAGGAFVGLGRLMAAGDNLFLRRTLQDALEAELVQSESGRR